jgi:hypothetical protein
LFQRGHWSAEDFTEKGPLEILARLAVDAWSGLSKDEGVKLDMATSTFFGLMVAWRGERARTAAYFASVGAMRSAANLGSQVWIQASKTGDFSFIHDIRWDRVAWEGFWGGPLLGSTYKLYRFGRDGPYKNAFARKLGVHTNDLTNDWRWRRREIGLNAIRVVVVMNIYANFNRRFYGTAKGAFADNEKRMAESLREDLEKKGLHWLQEHFGEFEDIEQLMIGMEQDLAVEEGLLAHALKPLEGTGQTKIGM